MPLAEFDLLDTSGLTQRHALPPMARRLHPDAKKLHGNVWAWFNPSAVEWRGKRWLAYRTECSPRWHWSRISLAQLDAKGCVLSGSNKLLRVPTGFGKWGAEDPRLTVWQDRLFLSYTDGWEMGFAELDDGGSVVTVRILRERKVVRNVLFEKTQREKNWGFFGTDDGFFVSYWVAPQVVFRFDERKGKLGERWETPWTVPADAGQLHGGSTPVAHDGLIWRVVHSHAATESGRHCYRLWLMAFEAKPPFAPCWFCAKPLVVAARDPSPVPEQVVHDVVFCGSAERASDGWRIFFGENDRRIRHGVVPDAMILPHWQAVR